MIQSYRDLQVWQKAIDLAEDCYRVTENFPDRERYGLSSQLRRAAVSIPANIAEGRNRQPVKEFLQHLSITAGSLAELETHLILAERFQYLIEDELNTFLLKTAEIGRMLHGLRKSLLIPHT
jgi:four helix bundle protein